MFYKMSVGTYFISLFAPTLFFPFPVANLLRKRARILIYSRGTQNIKKAAHDFH